MQIHIARDGQRLGPFPLEEVNRQLAAGSISLTDLAWYEGIPNWIALSQVPGIAPVSSTAAGTISSTTSAHYAGFWIRVVAYILDCIILGFAGALAGVVIGVVLAASGSDSAAIRQVSNVVGLLIGLMYFAAFWSSNMQASLGQKACGLRLIATDGGPVSLGRAIGRYFALILAVAILLIGVIMVAFTERKQGLHDMLAGTYVIKT